MMPKKIYLNYVNESDEDKTWSDTPISVSDCDMQNREYTDLSQVWHDAGEEPMRDKEPILLYSNNLKKTWISSVSEIYNTGEAWYAYVILSKITKWAYISDLLPKI